MRAAQNFTAGAVEADGFVMDQPRSGKAGQPHQIDMALGKAVDTGDVARQRARIGGLDIARDQAQAHP